MGSWIMWTSVGSWLRLLVVLKYYGKGRLGGKYISVIYMKVWEGKEWLGGQRS